MTITKDSAAPLFVVIGATGNQGSSVVNALQASPVSYRVRAVTRDPTTSAAEQLKTAGCEVVAGDVSVHADMDRAFEGAQFGFTMTVPGVFKGAADPFGQEVQEGKNQVDAAAAAGVKGLVWAGLKSMSELSGGKYTVDPFDAKAKVTAYARTLASSTFKVYDVQPGFYVTNFLESPIQRPRKLPDGSFGLPHFSATPDLVAKLPVIDVLDYGEFVIGAIESDKLETVYAASEYTTAAQRLAALQKVSKGKKIVHIRVSADEYTAQFKASGASESAITTFLNLIAGSEEFYYSGDDLEASNSILRRPVRSFEEGVLARREAFEAFFSA